MNVKVSSSEPLEIRTGFNLNTFSKSVVLKPLEDLLRHRLMGHTPIVSDTGGQFGAWDPAFLISPQVVLLLLVWDGAGGCSESRAAWRCTSYFRAAGLWPSRRGILSSLWKNCDFCRPRWPLSILHLLYLILQPLITCGSLNVNWNSLKTRLKYLFLCCMSLLSNAQQSHVPYACCMRHHRCRTFYHCRKLYWTALFIKIIKIISFFLFKVWLSAPLYHCEKLTKVLLQISETDIYIATFTNLFISGWRERSQTF